MRKRSSCLLLMAVLTFVHSSVAKADDGGYPIEGHYVGVLPCDDCSGIWTDLTLFGPGPTLGAAASYTMLQRYTGGEHGGKSVTSHGTWFTPDRSIVDATQRIVHGEIILHEEAPESKMHYFWSEYDRHLLPLDSKGQTLEKHESYSLERVIPATPPHFYLDEKMDGAEIAARLGDDFDVSLPIANNFDLLVWKASIKNKDVFKVSCCGGTGHGSQSTTHFHITAVSAGKATLVFENTKIPGQHVTMRFVIKPN